MIKLSIFFAFSVRRHQQDLIQDAAAFLSQKLPGLNSKSLNNGPQTAQAASAAASKSPRMIRGPFGYADLWSFCFVFHFIICNVKKYIKSLLKQFSFAERKVAWFFRIFRSFGQKYKHLTHRRSSFFSAKRPTGDKKEATQRLASPLVRKATAAIQTFKVTGCHLVHQTLSVTTIKKV